jgi:hypothetical protein
VKLVIPRKVGYEKNRIDKILFAIELFFSLPNQALAS